MINYQRTSIVICNGVSNLHDNAPPNYLFVHYADCHHLIKISTKGNIIHINTIIWRLKSFEVFHSPVRLVGAIPCSLMCVFFLVQKNKQNKTKSQSTYYFLLEAVMNTVRFVLKGFAYRDN